MRLLIIALFTLLFTMTATAIPLPVPIQINDMHGTPPAYAYGGSTPGDAYNASTSSDVLGYLRDFDIDYVKFTTIEAGKIEAQIHVNYAGGALDPLELDNWSAYSYPNNIQLNTGDLLFDVDGVYTYGVALTAHDGLTAGALYHIANDAPLNGFVKNSDIVLETTSGIRSGKPVWIDSSHADEIVGSGISLGSQRDGTTAAWFINLSFNPTGTSFISELATKGLSVHYASATCANDILDGYMKYGEVPEPTSMILMGGGLLALGLFGRRLRRV